MTGKRFTLLQVFCCFMCEQCSYYGPPTRLGPEQIAPIPPPPHQWRPCSGDKKLYDMGLDATCHYYFV